MLANQEFSSNQVSTLTSIGSIAKDNSFLKNSLKLDKPTSISLTPPNSNSESETEEEIATDDNALELDIPTSISLTPPNSDGDSQTEEETATDDNVLKLDKPTSISLTPPNSNGDSQTEEDDNALELDNPTSISLTPPDSDSESETEEEIATDDNALELDNPTSISLTPPDSNSESEIESPIPISLSALPVKLAVPETEEVIIASDNTSLSVGEFSAAVGGKVTVEIAIANATDLQSLDLEIYYDTEFLDIVDPIPDTEINEGVRRTGIAADWELLAESGDNPEASLANPIVNVVEDIGDGKTGKIDINLINPNDTPVSDSGKIIAIDFQVGEDAISESIATIDLRQAELGINGQTFNLGDSDSLLQDGSIIVGIDSIDIDGNGVAEPLNDGIVIIRHLFGAEGEGLTNGAIGNGATRTSAAAIKSYLNQIESSLDIDRNGIAEPLNDGILIIRRLFGAEGEGLTNGAIGSGANRTSPVDIANAIDNLAI